MTDTPIFSGKSVGVKKVAAITGKRESAIRKGLQTGALPIGCAIPVEGNEEDRDHYTYYISPKLLYEYTGAIVNDLAVGNTPRNSNEEES